jgi:uncharacterized repeat protein (TIGR01451 family)
MCGSSARRWRWTTALALGLLGCCALIQTGCLRPPSTPAESLGQQLYNIQPGVPVAGVPGPIDPSATAPAAAASPTVAPAPIPIAPPVAAPLAAAPPLVAAPPNPAAESSLLLSPGVVVAPVGANVVMVAGVFGPDHAPLAGRRVEWTLATGGVGQITAVGAAPGGFFGIGATSAQKVDPLYAVNETFSRNVLVARGAGTQLGDLTVGRGQTWITVSSPNEGATYVTALAPELQNWVVRQQTGLIHWVDAQWSAAPPAVGPAGSRHVFTTTITRRTTGEPLAGWHVRYEITGGPAAGFAPDGGRAIEVPTNELGQASAEIFQPQPESGASPVLIQVIRPAGIMHGGQRLVVGTAATEQIWTGPAGATPPTVIPTVPTGPAVPTIPTVPTVPSVPTTPPTPAGARTALRMTGPSQATVGATASYRIEVTNAGDQPATGIIVSDPLPEGLAYLQSTPQADAPAAAANLQWSLGTIQPGESRAIQLDTRTERAGAINHCASLRTAEGITGQECVTTTVRAAAIEMRLSGPDKATVGQQVRFELDIVNHGDTQITGLILKDRFDDGFVHATASSPIQVELKPFAANQGQKIGITFKVAKAGRLCHTVELSGPNGLNQTTQACLEATNPAPPSKPALSLKISGPKTAHVGEMVLFTIEVKNAGDTKIANLRIANKFDSRLLEARFADPGYEKKDSELSWVLASLDPGQTTQRQVKFICLADGRVCDKATASDGIELTLGDEACLEIAPAEPPPGAGGKLSLTAAARANPIKVGSDTSFVITVSNAGPNPEQKVALVVKIPEQMQYVEGAAQNPTKVGVVDGQTVRFEPIAQLAAGEKVTFEVRAHANRAGEAAFHAEATSPTTPQPVATDAKVTIFAE